ncbi:MAG: transcription elongation factor GreB, partial [Methylophilaceae bacterium]|nr:transcription elongation factor GreB [Methylophilaceae bacterium]
MAVTDEKNYITPEGFAALQAEFHALYKVERPTVVKTVTWAASNGDRSENGDYIYGKRRLRQIDSRCRHLMKRMDFAVIVDSKEQQHLEKVFFGAWVEIEN